jgi:hypothetical protein
MHSKCLYPSTELHDVTPQESTIVIITTVKNSKLCFTLLYVLFNFYQYLCTGRGRAIAQAVSPRRPGFDPRSCGICGGRSGTGAGFLRVLRFALPILIPPSTPHSSPIIRGWYNRPITGRRTKWTQSHPTPRNLT